ncbi:MAG: methionyl-tRNA formyltransferase [Deltaproteobacteria bacterium]|nr:methionyl-tRNA formyltransferase [Deltaproteobacteria bacterium]
MGTPEFARVSLAALVEAVYPIVGVFTQPDKPAGRGRHLHVCPTAELAREKKIPLFQPASLKNDETLSLIESMKPDFIVVAAYGKILPEKVLKAPRIDCINVHASLLPKYRGAAPINWALINGEEETGVSIMKLVRKPDAGPVYCEARVKIGENDTAGSLTSSLAKEGARLLIETIPKIAAAQITSQPQDDSQATMAPSLKKEDGRIDWKNKALVIHNRIRGVNPWPGAYTFVDNKLLKIYHSRVLTERPASTAGEIYFLNEKGIHVACGDGAILLTEVQIEGKKRMSAAEFVRGYRLEVGKNFS